MDKKKIVITGIGVSTSISDNHNDLSQSIRNNTFKDLNRQVGIQETAAEKVGKNLCRRMDNFTLYSLISALNALENSGLELDKENKSRIGTIYTTTWGPAYTTNKYFEPVIKAGVKGVSPILFPYTVSNAALGAVARITGLSGVSTMLVDTSAVDFAYTQLTDNKADVIVSGATENITSLINEFAFDEELNVPFDGSVSLVLETSEHAIARNAHIYAEIECGKSFFVQNSDDRKKLTEQVVEDMGADNIIISDEYPFDYLSLVQIISVICYIMNPEKKDNSLIVSNIGENRFNTLLMRKKNE